MTYKALRRDVTAVMLAFLLSLSATPGQAQTTSDTMTGQTLNQNAGQVAPADDQDDGMDLGWLGLLGLLGLLGMRRRHEVHRVDTTTRTARP
jgi:MYXO-CTERM domain-containing protein